MNSVGHEKRWTIPHFQPCEKANKLQLTWHGRQTSVMVSAIIYFTVGVPSFFVFSHHEIHFRLWLSMTMACIKYRSKTRYNTATTSEEVGFRLPANTAVLMLSSKIRSSAFLERRRNNNLLLMTSVSSLRSTNNCMMLEWTIVGNNLC